MNCSLGTSHRYVRTYYTRMFEVKFILGALAGTLTESGKLGYVCDYPLYGQIAGINAFALGARMTCPKAKVYLEWSGIKGAEEAAKSLREQNIRIISSQDTARFLKDDRMSFGLSYVSGDEKRLLANPVWNWGRYYEEILNRYLDKSMQEEYEKSNKALNYYWGMSAGVADVMYSDALATSSKHFCDLLKDSIIHNLFTPFRTPLVTQDGTIIGEGEPSLTLKEIVTMDYLVENVIGEIPQYEDLSPMGKATVDTPAGIENAQSTADIAAKSEPVKPTEAEE
jgi:basic membrane lipoprotein Med (substrate-binding protein (PBP1-ABC) superfamily)